MPKHTVRTVVLKHIEEEAYEARNDKIIQRINGDDSVFRAIDEHSMFLVPGKPALNQQVNTSIAEASKVAGVLGSITSHNLHREGAKDVAYMTQDLRGIAHMAVANFSGPSAQDSRRRHYRRMYGFG